MITPTDCRRMDALETAILATTVTADFERSGFWPALRDLRRGHARTLGLGGLILCNDHRVVYALEGSSRYLDRFMQMLDASPCETDPTLLVRKAVTQRAYPTLTLISPVLTEGERAGLRRELALPPGEQSVLPTLLTWLSLRQAEASASGHSERYLAFEDPFPPAADNDQ